MRKYAKIHMYPKVILGMMIAHIKREWGTKWGEEKLIGKGWEVSLQLGKVQGEALGRLGV